ARPEEARRPAHHRGCSGGIERGRGDARRGGRSRDLPDGAAAAVWRGHVVPRLRPRLGRGGAGAAGGRTRELRSGRAPSSREQLRASAARGNSTAGRNSTAERGSTAGRNRGTRGDARAGRGGVARRSYAIGSGASRGNSARADRGGARVRARWRTP